MRALWNLFKFGARKEKASRPAPANLHVEHLEDRCLPSAALPLQYPVQYAAPPTAAPLTAPQAASTFHNFYGLLMANTTDSSGNPEFFFTDGNHQVWKQDNGVFTALGFYATRLSANSGMIVFTDGNNLVYIYNDATQQVINTGAYAQHLAAGAAVFGGPFAFIDGSNQVWGLSATGTATNTGIFATRLSLGQDPNGKPIAFFTDGLNQVWQDDNGATKQLGFFATRLATGDGDLAFTDGNNQLWLYSDGTGQFTFTGAYATRLDSGSNRGKGGQSLFAFTDASNQLWTMNSQAKFTFTGAYALRVTEGLDASGLVEVLFLDGSNLAHIYDQGVVI
jgi:hypothetical protein